MVLICLINLLRPFVFLPLPIKVCGRKIERREAGRETDEAGGGEKGRKMGGCVKEGR